MTKEVKQLLQQFSNKYEDISKIKVHDYEQFLNEKIEEKIDLKTIQELRNLLNLYYLETKEHQVSFSSFLIRYFSVYEITYKKDINKRRKQKNICGNLKKLKMTYVDMEDMPLPDFSEKEYAANDENGHIKFI